MSWGDSIWVWTVGQNYHFIQKLAGYGIRGTIFYQGESNGFLGFEHYQTRFPALIRDWRRQWGQGDFPFLYVQLPNYLARKISPQFDSDWPAVRDAQRRALEMPNTGMASTIDIGDPLDIHPRDKFNVGKRLAFLARRRAYGENGLVSSGPLVRSMTILGNRIHLRFSSIGGGLVSTTGPVLQGFSVAGEDNQYHWANAVIHGETVVVSHPHVLNPKNVRYGWADNPVISLFNSQALPASPFTTEGGRVRHIPFSPTWRISSELSSKENRLPGKQILHDIMGRRISEENKGLRFAFPSPQLDVSH
jgi:sialate O-acetylesterase